MKKSILLFCLLLIAQSNPAKSENKSIKIGASLALSGNLAFIGIAQQRGFELAKDEINNSGGIKGKSLEILNEDNAGDAKTALSGVNKLLLVDNADIIFSSFTHITQAIKSEVQNANKILLYQSTVGSIAEESPLFFRDYADAKSGGETMGKVTGSKGYKNIAILSEIGDACNDVISGLKTSLPQDTKILTEETFSRGESDFKPLLLKIKTKKPDALALCTWRDSSLIMPQLKNLGMLKIPTIQYLAPFLPISDTPELRKLFEENKTLSIWIGFIESDLNNVQTKFAETYKNKFNEMPRLEALLAYDEVMILKKAIEDCDASENELNPTCIASKLNGNKFSGVSGDFSFNDKGVSIREDLLIEVKNGKWVESK
jgi:branched-chain amino acid transport system substrate-binding protein